MANTMGIPTAGDNDELLTYCRLAGNKNFLLLHDGNNRTGLECTYMEMADEVRKWCYYLGEECENLNKANIEPMEDF